MDCRILRLVTLKANGQIVRDDSSGYGIVPGEVGLDRGWNVRSVCEAPVYGHVRRAFAKGRVPWPGVCERCHIFPAGGAAHDTLAARIRLMIGPTLACELAFELPMSGRAPLATLGLRVHAGNRQHDFSAVIRYDD